MKRVVDVLYGLKGYPNAARFTEFKTDLFANGTTPTITWSAGYTSPSIRTGTYASTADNGVILSSTNTYNAAFLADDSGSSIGDSVRNVLARTLLTITQAGGSIRSVMGQLKSLTGVNLGTGVYTAVQGYLEFAGTHSVASGGKVSGVDVSIEVGASKTLTVASGGYLAGVKIELTASSGTATVTQTGDCAAVYVDKNGTITDWKVGVDLQNCTTGIDIGACTTGINFSGAAGTACLDFAAGSVTTGSLFDYVGITGKVSGYIFNGSMTTSTLTASTLIDDFSCSCASDGLAADTLRGIRRIWSGAMPNGTAAVDFVLCELQWGSVFGTAATKGGTPKMLLLDCNATINDSSANFYALDVDLAGMTLTSCANIHGIQVTTMTGVDAGINHTGNATSAYQITSGTITNAFNILAAANITNLFKFNAAAGCILNVDVNPADDPSDGGLGADACIRIDIGGADYFIPIFATELS